MSPLAVSRSGGTFIRKHGNACSMRIDEFSIDRIIVILRHGGNCVARLKSNEFTVELSHEFAGCSGRHWRDARANLRATGVNGLTGKQYSRQTECGTCQVRS